MYELLHGKLKQTGEIRRSSRLINILMQLFMGARSKDGVKNCSRVKGP